MERVLWHRALKIPLSIREKSTPPLRSIRNFPRQPIRHASFLPTIAQPSFWKGLIPKPFRRPEQSAARAASKKPRSKEWNPATFFIVIFLFIGSMSIQMIALRRDFNTFTRRAEVRIGLLREVVQKLQRGEEVDVEKTLGTGDPEKEQEWDEILKEIVRDDAVKVAKRAERKKSTTPTAGETVEQPKETPASANFSSFF